MQELESVKREAACVCVCSRKIRYFSISFIIVLQDVADAKSLHGFEKHLKFIGVINASLMH